MAIARSLLLSHDFRSSNGHNNGHKGLRRKGGLHLFSVTLSSNVLLLKKLGSRQDAWSHHELNGVCRPKSSQSSRCNVFQCQAFLLPSGGDRIPVLKTAATTLTKSYKSLNISPIFLQLVLAVGVIAFAAWGLGPLMRLSRVHLFNKSDDSWKTSSTHLVMTSYLQPLLLWTGATLICRALDPIILPTQATQAAKQQILDFVRSLSTVLAFGYCLSSFIKHVQPHVQKLFMETNDSNDARNMGFQFAGKAISTAVWVGAFSLFMELLGISPQKLLTAGGLGTVLLTLAGREIFTNFLSSVIIHATRPFVASDWIRATIQGDEVSGTVEHVGWWSPTIIRGDDREAIRIPNKHFTTNVVRNLSQRTHWRIKTYVAISHLDVNKIPKIIADMRKVLAKNPQVEQRCTQKYPRRVFMESVNLENPALMIMVSCFVKTSHFEEYLSVQEAVLLDCLRVISHHRARLATPMRTVQNIYCEADIDNLPFADTMYTGSRAGGNRLLLLMEPYTSNSNDKPRASTRSVHTNEEQDPKDEATSIPDSTARLNSRLSAASKSDPQTPNAASVGPIQDSEEEKVNKSGNSRESGGEKTEIPSTVSHAKQEGERTVASPSASRASALEENIVLEVALEGSRRTLPIEEETPPLVTNVESKELAASRNGSASTSVGVDKKDEQHEKER